MSVDDYIALGRILARFGEDAGPGDFQPYIYVGSAPGYKSPHVTIDGQVSITEDEAALLRRAWGIG